MTAVLILWALLTAMPGIAQENPGDWSAFTSMRTMEAVLFHEDRVWCATSGGVLRYDPGSGEYERFTRLEGLAGNRVLSAAADADGHLWFGTDRQGLSRLRVDGGEFDPPFVEFLGLPARALVPRQGQVYVGTDQGISVFLADELVVRESYLQLGDFLKDTGVHALAVDDGVIWAGTDLGVAWADLTRPNLKDPGSWDTWSHGAPVVDLMVHDAAVLCATDSGLFAFDPEAGVFAADFPNSVAFTALGTWDGAPIAATGAGDLYRRDGALEWTRVAEAISEVRALSRGDESLWIATADGLRRHGSPSPGPPDEPPANQFYEMALQEAGGLWMASVPSDRVTPALGLYQFDGTWKVHDRGSGLPMDVLVSLATDAADRVWVGTWGNGLAVQDNSGGWQNLTWSNSDLFGIRDNNTFVVVSDIERDGAGLMWLANVQAGLVVMDGYPPTRSLRHSQEVLDLEERWDIGRIAISPSGLKWISTPLHGFLLFDDGDTPFEEGDEKVIRVHTGEHARLTSDRVTDIHVAAGDVVWVATDNGLNAVETVYDRQTATLEIVSWRVYTTEDGVPSDQITALESDTQGRIWIATQAGLGLIDVRGEFSRSYTTANSGLIDNRINSLLFDAGEGALWIGTRDGLSRLRVAADGFPAHPAIHLYPNPFSVGASSPVTISGIRRGLQVQIFTVDGQLVRKLTAESQADRTEWAGENEAGFLVASGVYLVAGEDAAGKRVRAKLAVINQP